jgi:hypothetical protein
VPKIHVRRSVVALIPGTLPRSTTRGVASILMHNNS